MGRRNGARATALDNRLAQDRGHARDLRRTGAEQRPAGGNQRSCDNRSRTSRRQCDLRRERQAPALPPVRRAGRRMSLPPDHPPVPEPQIGVLLINLGTPDAPEVRAVRRYLAEFLSDPRVVEIPAIAWKPILHGLILRTRPRKSAEAYNQVWTNEGSPLAVVARRQAHALREHFDQHVNVHYAMRYGNPGIAAALANMVREGCRRIFTAPLYPQYCAATTATANDAVFAALAAMRVQPALRTLPPYYDHPLYIEALRANLTRQ